MGESFLRAQTRKFLGYAVNHPTRELDASAMRGPTVVFAPHQDDETLGCGGTIIKKKRLGGDVSIVFVTDGSRSHDLIPTQELKSIRVKEALAASRLLGVTEGDVTFLEFEDGKLGEHLASATDRVIKVLRERRFEQIFIPYCKITIQAWTILPRIGLWCPRLKRSKARRKSMNIPSGFGDTGPGQICRGVGREKP